MDQLVLDLDLSADGLSSGGMHFRDVHRADRRDRHSVLEEANVVWEQNRAVSCALSGLFELFAPTDVTSSPAEAANLVRLASGISAGPVPSVVELLRRMGIIVGAMPQVDGGISAFSCWVARDPVILLKASDHGRRRARFDAAHELGHLLLHRNLAEDRAIERQADEFAAHLLLPPTELHSRLSAPFNWDEVVSTANHFDVSNAAVISGAHHAGAIGNRLYSAAMAEAAKRGWLRHNVPDSEPTELARDSVSKSRRLAS